MSVSVYRFMMGDVYEFEWLTPVWPKTLIVARIDRINKVVYLGELK